MPKAQQNKKKQYFFFLISYRPTVHVLVQFCKAITKLKQFNAKHEAKQNKKSSIFYNIQIFKINITIIQEKQGKFIIYFYS